MAGISSKALNSAPENKMKYQGYEFNNDFDLNLYESFYRTHDPQIGRWWQIDPKPESGLQYSPYVAMNNNPISLTDLLGDIVEYEKGDGVSKKEFRQFKREIRQMRRNSESFGLMYNEFEQRSETFVYKAVNAKSGGETIKTEKGYQMSISINGKFTEQKNKRFSRIEQDAHETGHAWMKLHNFESPDPKLNTTSGMDRAQATNAINEQITGFVNNRNSREISTSHISNIVMSELMNSGSLHFTRLNLAQYYYGGMGTELDPKSGILFKRYDIDIPVLLPPKDRSYYLNTKFDLYDEFKKKNE